MGKIWIMTTENRQATRRREAILQAVSYDAQLVLAESGQLVVIAQKLHERVLEALSEADGTVLPSDGSLPATTTR